MSEEKGSGAPAAGSAQPDDTITALRKWDAGEPVFTVEMGGLGPGYEQCIHILAFEIIRDNEPIPDKTFGDWGDAAVKRCDLGFSGAQVGAAKQLAYRFLTKGHRATLDEVESDRRIQVSRAFPRPPAADAAPAAPKEPQP